MHVWNTSNVRWLYTIGVRIPLNWDLVRADVNQLLYAHELAQSVCAAAPTVLERKIPTSSVYVLVAVCSTVSVDRRSFWESIRSSISIRVTL